MMNDKRRYIMIISIAVACFAVGFGSSFLIDRAIHENDVEISDETSDNDNGSKGEILTPNTDSSDKVEIIEPSKQDSSTDNSATTKSQTTPTTPSAEGKYVQPAGAEWNLRLVNNWNRMSQNEANSLPITNFRDGQQCDSRIANQLEAMLSAGAEYGLWVTSSYRSYDRQNQLYENKITRVMNARGCSREEAEPIAAAEVARPGTSEHNTGLAFDLLNNQCNVLEREWEDTPAFDWLQEHCAEYGFILRFPEGKEHITGIIYEPWHYRYVGVEAAKEIMSKGLCLEEYLEQHGK